MEKVEVILQFQNLKKAFSRLKEAVNVAETDLEKDGVIQRFEFTFELFWKFLKAFLEYNGIECYSPRNCIKTAFRYKLLEDDEIFLDMLEDRNKSSHIYNKQQAEEIFERIKSVYAKILENNLKTLEEKLQKP